LSLGSNHLSSRTKNDSSHQTKIYPSLTPRDGLFYDGVVLGGAGHWRIYRFPEFEELGQIVFNSNLSTPIFDKTDKQLAFVHTDEDGERAQGGDHFVLG
jgi:hypothetical protein